MSAFRYFVVILAVVCSSFGLSSPSTAKPKARKTLPFTVPPRTHAGTIFHVKSELQRLGYWVLKLDTMWDISARHSLIAFQKIDSLPRTGILNRAVFNALESATRVQPSDKGPRHIEVDLDRQVLFVVGDTGSVEKILPVSSGSGQYFKIKRKKQLAATPTGQFKVQRKLEGMHQSPLGLLYYPMFFTGGFAIHGENGVPVTAQSHGCIRIPNYAALELWEATPIGTPVIIHGKNPENKSKK